MQASKQIVVLTLNFLNNKVLNDVKNVIQKLETVLSVILKKRTNSSYYLKHFLKIIVWCDLHFSKIVFQIPEETIATIFTEVGESD